MARTIAHMEEGYLDTGCRIHPSCLRCPRARCIFDEEDRQETAVIMASRRSERDAEVRRMRESLLLPVAHIATNVGISESRVRQILRAAGVR